MADAKRYYWLRLHDDFFDSKRIKKLRRMAGGDTYTIIYLKMQLLAMKTDGVITWTGLEAEFADELALDIDEEPDNVKATLNYLISCGLIETTDFESFFFPYAVSNTGCESSSAKRVRDYRKKQETLQCNTNALQCNAPTLQCNKNVTESNSNSKIQKKEIDIESRSSNGDDDDIKKMFVLSGSLARGKVILSSEQIEDLVEKLGYDMFNRYVEKLTDFIESKNANIKSHYQTILKWYNEDKAVQRS